MLEHPHSMNDCRRNSPAPIALDAAQINCASQHASPSNPIDFAICRERRLIAILLTGGGADERPVAGRLFRKSDAIETHAGREGLRQR